MHLARYQQEFQPVGVLETQLVQNLADTQWRLDRIANLEAGIFALGRLQYDELFKGQEARHLLDAHILMTEAKHFKNLHLQESRLRRRYQQDAQELKELQAERKKSRKQRRKKEPREPPNPLMASNLQIPQTRAATVREQTAHQRT